MNYEPMIEEMISSEGGNVDLPDDEWLPYLTEAELDRLQFAAEHPDLVDPTIRALPERKFSIRSEETFRKMMKAELRRKNAEEAARQNGRQGQLTLTVWAAH